MVEASQSVLRVVVLIVFTLLFAGLWANDKPREIMAKHSDAQSGLILTQDSQELAHDADQHIESRDSVSQLSFNELSELSNETVQLGLQIEIESTGLTLSNDEIDQHIRKLPMGIADGDYLIVDPQGGVGWIKIRGQHQADQGETLLTTRVGANEVRYVRVTPTQIAVEMVKSFQ